MRFLTNCRFWLTVIHLFRDTAPALIYQFFLRHPGSSFQIVVKAGDREAALGEIKKLKPKIAVPDVVWVIKT